jgi:zinc protease
MTGFPAQSSLPSSADVFDTTLANGLRVLVRENHTSPSVVFDAFLPGGSVLDPAQQAGLSSFAASMLMRGTERRTFDEINDAIESVGAALSISSGRHAAVVSGKSLAEDFGVLLEIMGDSLRSPIFPAEHVERVRGQRLTALQERDNNTRAVASLLFRELAYPSTHPYSRPIDGFQETIAALSRDEIMEFYRRTYGPQGGIMVVVGAVRADDAVRLVQQALDGWQGQTPPPAQFPDVFVPTAVVAEEKVLAGKTQSDIVLGVPALRRDDPGYYAARLADTVLGRFGMMGRLGDNVREKLGLAYYAYSALEAGKEPGPWMVAAGVNPADVDRCLAAVDEELARLGTDLVPEQELDDSKAFLTGSLPLRLETNEGVSQTILDMAWYNLGLDYLLGYADLIRGISAEEVRAVAATYLRPQAYALAIAGPERKRS